jgi:hypothetical protein
VQNQSGELAPIRIISNTLSVVMAGLVPAIHVLLAVVQEGKAWLPATSAGMTAQM